MHKNRIMGIILAICLVLGTIPITLGAAPTNKVYISALYVGALGETPSQEYVKITNSGKSAVSMKGWKITDEGNKHKYFFPSSYVLKSKSTVTVYTGKGKNTSTKLYWGMGWYVWNNHDPEHDNYGDTAYLYNAQKKLVSSKKG